MRLNKKKVIIYFKRIKIKLKIEKKIFLAFILRKLVPKEKGQFCIIP